MGTFSRREVLGLGALLCLPSLARADGSAAAPRFLSAASDADDRHWVLGVEVRSGSAQTLFRRQLPARAHHIAVNQARGFYVVLARRPGTWLQLGELGSGNLLHELQLPADRHLFGHGVFSAAGDWFYTTDSAFDDPGDNGRVGVWRVEGTGATATLVRENEFATRGVGPHELLLHPDGATLVVANGGIRTHPSRDRVNLNVDSMLPSLVYLDRRDGSLLEQHFLPPEFHQSGLRHLDVNAEGLVALGMQFEGEPWREVPLVATQRRGEPLQLLTAPPQIQPQMQQYVGSVRFGTDGRHFAVSCPKGNMLQFWSSAGELLHTTRARDGCGVCATATGFLFSTGTGRLAHYDPATDTTTDLATEAELQRLFWDNHLSLMGATG